MDMQEQVSFLDQFESHYKYDARYLRDLLNHSPEGYAKFGAFMPMSTHKGSLDNDVFWVAKLAAMQAEDCGSCLQLNIRMALEAGVDRELIRRILDNGSGLPDNLATVYKFARSIAQNEPLDGDTEAKVESQLSQTDRLEIGLCVAAARVFPTLKRAAGYSQSCELMEFEA